MIENLTRIGHVLYLCGAQPNRRFKPKEGDQPGWHYWFDGGAGIVGTGSSRILLTDGTMVYGVDTPTPTTTNHLLTIEFPTGERYELSRLPSRT